MSTKKQKNQEQNSAAFDAMDYAHLIEMRIADKQTGELRNVEAIAVFDGQSHMPIAATFGLRYVLGVNNRPPIKGTDLIGRLIASGTLQKRKRLSGEEVTNEFQRLNTANLANRDEIRSIVARYRDAQTA